MQNTVKSVTISIKQDEIQASDLSQYTIKLCGPRFQGTGLLLPLIKNRQRGYIS
jgi:hypothetical protein